LGEKPGPFTSERLRSPNMKYEEREWPNIRLERKRAIEAFARHTTLF
jgi:hypothetical protein